ncbi:hypothetical protein LCGC14_3079970, partial [marine sediment metagenome]
INRRAIGCALLIAIGLLLWAFNVTKTRGPSRVGKRFSSLEELFHPEGVPGFAVLYPRLFSGGTVYRYIPGSHAWLEWPNREWPSREGTDGLGADGVLFWCILPLAVLLILRPSPKGRIRWEDRALVATWALTVAAFWLLAGPRAMVPGIERNALCLLAPTAILASRGVGRCYGMSPRWLRVVLACSTLIGWFAVADFHRHYFDVLTRTGGRSEQTFRTAQVEPKQAALQIVLQHRKPGTTWIVASQWWNYWPIQYFAMVEDDVRVANPNEAQTEAGFELALSEGREAAMPFYPEVKPIDAYNAAILDTLNFEMPQSEMSQSEMSQSEMSQSEITKSNR